MHSSIESDVAVTVTDDVPAGVPVAVGTGRCAKLQLPPTGRPAQAKRSASLNPAAGVMVSTTLAL